MNDKEKVKSFQNWLGKIFIKSIIIWPLVVFSACFMDTPVTSLGLELFFDIMILSPFAIGLIYILSRIYSYFKKD